VRSICLFWRCLYCSQGHARPRMVQEPRQGPPGARCRNLPRRLLGSTSHPSTLIHVRMRVYTRTRVSFFSCVCGVPSFFSCVCVVPLSSLDPRTQVALKNDQYWWGVWWHRRSPGNAAAMAKSGTRRRNFRTRSCAAPPHPSSHCFSCFVQLHCSVSSLQTSALVETPASQCAPACTRRYSVHDVSQSSSDSSA